MAAGTVGDRIAAYRLRTVFSGVTAEEISGETDAGIVISIEIDPGAGGGK